MLSKDDRCKSGLGLMYASTCAGYAAPKGLG